METERVTRIDSPSHGGILLDVRRGSATSRATRSSAAPRRSRGCARPVTTCASSPTTRRTRVRRWPPRSARSESSSTQDDELQTTPIAAAHALTGKRVLALTMPSIVEDLHGLELVGEGADAVLLGGADESFETNRVFSYYNLARAFAELQDGAELYCLHKNRWWQTSRGALPRGRVRRRPRVRGRDGGDRARKPSAATSGQRWTSSSTSPSRRG